MFEHSNPRVGCSISITNRWTCSSLFDVWKMAISFLPILVFYLPSDSGEKVRKAFNSSLNIWKKHNSGSSIQWPKSSQSIFSKFLRAKIVRCISFELQDWPNFWFGQFQRVKIMNLAKLKLKIEFWAIWEAKCEFWTKSLLENLVVFRFWKGIFRFGAL